MSESPVGSESVSGAEAPGSAPAVQGGAMVRDLLHELVRSASEIESVVDGGGMEEAIALLNERNRTFELVREAVESLRQMEAEQLDSEVVTLLADAGAAHFRVTRALDRARSGLRREMASAARGSSAGSAYGRAEEAPPGGRLDERR